MDQKNSSQNSPQKKAKNCGQPSPNGSFGMPKAGRGLNALNNVYRQE